MPLISSRLPLLLVLVSSLVIAQTSRPATKTLSDYTDAATQMCAKSESDDDDDVGGLCGDKLAAVLRHDVIAFFGCEECATALQTKVYARSDDYKEKLQTLKKKHKTALKKKYYVLAKDDVAIGDYDLSRKGLSVTLETGDWPTRLKDSPPLRVGEFCFPSVPSKKVTDEYGPSWSAEVFLAASEKLGLKIEKNRDSAKVYLFFKVTRVGTYHREEAEGTTETVICPVAREVTLLIADGDDILLAKTYK